MAQNLFGSISCGVKIGAFFSSDDTAAPAEKLLAIHPLKWKLSHWETFKQ